MSTKKISKNLQTDLMRFLQTFMAFRPLAVRRFHASSSSLSLAAFAEYLPPPNPVKKAFLLNYEYVENIMEARTPFRESHLGLATMMLKDKDLIMAGAAGAIGSGEADSGVFVFNSEEKAREFVKLDEYYKNNLVTSYTLKEWMVPVY